MYKAVLALLVGLMLSVSGSAWGATTFKDGVISSDNILKKNGLNETHSPIEDSYKTAVRYKNKKFKEFRKLTIHSTGQKAVTVTGFNQWKGFGGWKAEGIFFFGEEICSWNSKITSSDGTGRFKAACPSLKVEGNYKVAGIKSGSSGQGKDSFGRQYRFVLGPASDSREVKYRELLNLYLAKNEVAIAEYFADANGFVKSITGNGNNQYSGINLAKLIQSKIASVDGDLARSVNIKTKKGSAIFTGKVKFPEERVLVTKLAWEVPGVKEVINELHVVDKSSLQSVSRDLAASAQLRGKLIADPKVNSLGFSIDVVNGTVYLTGIASDKQQMDRVVNHARELRFAEQVVNYIIMAGDRMPMQASAGSAKSSSTQTKSSVVPIVDSELALRTDEWICWHVKNKPSHAFREEAERRGISCGGSESGTTQVLTTAKEPAVSSFELNAARMKADSERQKRIQLEQELAALKASKAEDELKIAWDNRSPTINVDSRQKDEATVVVFGIARDNTGIADLLVNNDPVPVAADGSFETSLYIPPVGLTVEIVAYDQKGNKAIETLQLKRSTSQVSQETRFAQLQPSLGKRGLPNKNALALIVGIENYENLPARPSIHADNDAEYFSDFAHYKLGVPRNNIIKAINADAKRLDILKAITKVTKLSTKDETDVFIFFAGHGLAADDGEDVFLMPHDGDKDYLEATAMTRSEIFQLVERIGPKSVTVFLDACYTGGTRSQDVTLVAGKRPVQVVALEQSIPSGFTILSASAADETSMALEAANHGLFSYFLMKGMEGDADADKDDKITMAEMRDYVKDKVVRQSDFQQTPELQGDADRVLVQFQ